MMLMQVTCPHCGARYQFERSLIPQSGYDAQCANCSGIFVVAPDASGNDLPIALPSMSMIDTWLAPPALAPKSSRPPGQPVHVTHATQGVAARVEEPVVRDVTPRSSAARPNRDAPATVTAMPVGGRAGPAASVFPGDAAALQFSIACPSCDTVYAFAANDIPAAGITADCTQCHSAYRLTRIGDPNEPAYPPVVDDGEAEAATDILRPLQPEVLSTEKIEPALADALAEAPIIDLAASAMDVDEDTTPNGDLPARPEPRIASEAALAAHPTLEEGPPRSTEPGIEDATLEEPIAEEITKPLAVVPVLVGVDATDDDEDEELDDTVVQPRDDVAERPADPVARAIVPMAVSERSRAGAATWGPPDPQAMMRSRVRTSGEANDRSKKRRPPFDDDDVARMRRDGGPIIGDPREFDDEDSVVGKLGLRGKHRVTILGVTGVVLIVGIVCAMVPALTGRSILQVLHLRPSRDPRVQELVTNARAALLADTDVGYRDASKAANEALDIDASNPESRVLYGISAVFRGVDVRAAAQNMVAEGEVVQSSQMLATASAELAHARRVLSRKNDESAELAFTAGIYYALDEDQRDHAHDAYLRGLRQSRVAESAEPPTPYAAYLLATLKNLEGDAAGARAALTRAMMLEPRWQRPRFELARLEGARGEVAKARELLAELLASVPEHNKARELLAALPEAPAAPTVAVKPPQAPVQPDPPKVVPVAAPPKPVDPAKTDTLPETAPPSEVKKPEPRPKGPEPRDAAAPEITTPPDQPTIIRGAPPPFQPRDNEPGPESGGTPPSEAR